MGTGGGSFYFGPALPPAPAAPHPPEPVGARADDGQVVGDDPAGQAVLVPPVGEERQDLVLHRHVQGGDDLVRHQELRPHEEGPGDGQPLQLAAGKLRRGLFQAAGVHPALEQQGLDLRQALPPAVLRSPELQGLLQEGAHPPGGVQAVEGVLGDHLEPAPQGAELPGRQVLEDPAAVGHGAAVRPGQAQEDACQGGLSAAGFPQQADDLAPADPEGHVVHRRDAPAPVPRHGEGLAQMFRPQDHVFHGAPPSKRRPVSSASSRV